MAPTPLHILYAVLFGLACGGLGALWVAVYGERRHHADDPERQWSNFTRWGRKRFPG
jgi:hypothetical protein